MLSFCGDWPCLLAVATVQISICLFCALLDSRISLSFGLSLSVFPLMGRIKASGEMWFGWVVILTYLIAIGIGGIAGIVIGFIGAKKINARLGWQHYSN
jgi:ABC-type xylose transport system permease subunit